MTINKTLVSEKSALQKTVDRLWVTLRSVQEEVGYWKARYNKVMEFFGGAWFEEEVGEVD